MIETFRKKIVLNFIFCASECMKKARSENKGKTSEVEVGEREKEKKQKYGNDDDDRCTNVLAVATQFEIESNGSDKLCVYTQNSDSFRLLNVRRCRLSEMQ